VKITVIIPTYRSAKFIERALLSICKQTMKPIEVIVVETGMEDEICEILERFHCEGIILRKVCIPRRYPPSFARNVGIRLATGEYIAFLDSDDEYLPQKLSKSIATIESDPDRDRCVVYNDAIVVDDRSKTMIIARAQRFNLLRFLLFRFITFSSIVLPRSFIVQNKIFFDSSKPLFDDFDFIIKCYKKGAKFIYIPYPLVIYHIHGQSTLNKRILGIKITTATLLQHKFFIIAFFEPIRIFIPSLTIE